jgi:hypothetical protein
MRASRSRAVCIDLNLVKRPSQFDMVAIECTLKYALLADRLLSAASDRLVQHTAAKLASTPNNDQPAH